MGILGWVIFGLIVGLLARAVMPGRDNMGLIATTILGILGAVVAGWIGTAVGWYERDSGAGLIASLVGALVVLWVYNAAVRGRSRKNVTRHDRDRFAA